MANPQLTVEITAKIDGLRDSFNKAVSEIKGLDGKTKSSLSSIDKSFGKLANDVEKSMGSITNSTKSASNSISQSLAKSAQASASSGTAIAKGSNQAAFALNNLGRVAQDAPFGFIGIQNNLNPLLESFQRLKAETGSNTSAFKALGSSLLGAGGIGLALSVVSSAFLFYQQYARGAKDNTDALASSFETFSKALESTEYKKVVSNINELKINIGLAKDGFLDKKDVLNQYNETIGKTTGKVTSLDRAEKEIVKNGQAVIRMTLLKAAAQLALEEAAKSAFEAERVRERGRQGITRDGEGAQKNFTIGQRLEAAFAQDKNVTDSLIKKSTDDLTKKSDERTKSFENIALKFQTDAAKIAKDFNFNFFDPKETKTGAAKNPKVEALIKQGYQLKEVFSGIKLGNLGDPTAQIIQVKLIEQAVSALDRLRASFGYTDDELIDFVSSYGVSLSQLETMTIDFNDKLSGILNNGIISTFGNLGSAIGSALENGTSVAEAAGQSLLSSLGGILTQLGELAIATGVGIQAIKTALKSLNPVVAITAGVALVALGSLVKGKASKIGGGGGGSSATPNRRFGGTTASIQSPSTQYTGNSNGPTSLKSMVAGGGTQTIILDARLGNDAIYLAAKRGEKQQRKV